jgi:hypothetical protein
MQSDGIAEVIRKLEQLERDGFYGSVTLVYEAGRLDRYELKQSVKVGKSSIRRTA